MKRFFIKISATILVCMQISSGTCSEFFSNFFADTGRTLMISVATYAAGVATPHILQMFTETTDTTKPVMQPLPFQPCFLDFSDQTEVISQLSLILGLASSQKTLTPSYIIYLGLEGLTAESRKNREDHNFVSYSLAKATVTNKQAVFEAFEKIVQKKYANGNIQDIFSNQETCKNFISNAVRSNLALLLAQMTEEDTANIKVSDIFIRNFSSHLYTAYKRINAVSKASKGIEETIVIPKKVKKSKFLGIWPNK